MVGGYLGKCKECTKKDVKQNRQDNLEHYLAHDKQRSKLPHRLEARRLYSKTEAGRAAKQRASKAYIERFHQEYKARVAFGNAVRDGKIFKWPCEVCGNAAEGHHPHYGMPLIVVWLCDKHHKEVHAQTKELNSGRP